MPFVSIKDGRIPWQMKLTDEQGRPRYPFLILDSVAMRGPIITPDEQQRRDEYLPRDLTNLAEVREGLGRLARRAFRRPVPPDELDRYVGKTVVDTLVVRLGDVFSAAVVWVGTRMMWPTAAFAGFNLGLITVWLGIVYVIGKEHARRSDETEEQLAAEPVAA